MKIWTKPFLCKGLYVHGFARLYRRVSVCTGVCRGVSAVATLSIFFKQLPPATSAVFYLLNDIQARYQGRLLFKRDLQLCKKNPKNRSLQKLSTGHRT